MPPDHPVRLATPGDAPEVEAVVAMSYAPYVARLGRKPGPMLDDYPRLIAAGRVHVVSDAGGIAGLIVLIDEEQALLLDNVAVHPRAAGRGFGRRLLEFAEAFAGRAGFARIRLYTHELMVENISLYRRIGYIETHRAVQNGFPRVFFEKRLAP